MFNVRVVLNGTIWRHHFDQLLYCYASDDDQHPGGVSSFQDASPEVANDIPSEEEEASFLLQAEAVYCPQRPLPEEYTCQSKRLPDYYVSQP